MLLYFPKLLHRAKFNPRAKSCSVTSLNTTKRSIKYKFLNLAPFRVLLKSYVEHYVTKNNGNTIL